MNTLKHIRTLQKILVNYRKRAVVLDTLPIRLWIESSLACNLKCGMCPNKDLPNAGKGIMDFFLFRRIIDEAAGFAHDVNIHHRGEPLLNPRFPEMIVYAKKKGLRVRFHTNATLLDEDKARRIIDAGPDLVSVSFDGFQKDIYEEVRAGASFERTVGNVERFLDIRRSSEKNVPYTVVERIDFPALRDRLDPEQVNALTRRFSEHGLNEVIIKQEYNWTLEDLPDISRQQRYKVCTFPWYATVICWDGTVTPCPQDFMARMNMGNVNEKSISGIWNDTPYQTLRRNLVSDLAALELCKKCDRLCRKQVGGVPFQYLVSFLCDQFAGYGRLRKLVGSFERN